MSLLLCIILLLSYNIIIGLLMVLTVRQAFGLSATCRLTLNVFYVLHAQAIKGQILPFSNTFKADALFQSD